MEELLMESKKVDLNGCSYHYLEYANAGKPKLLLLHGIIVEAHFWSKIVDLLKDKYHIYALDMKGHGQTDDGKSYIDDYSPEAISNDLFAFHEKVIKEPFYFVGYSLGGQFALHYAANHGDTLRKLVLLDSAPSVSLKGLFTLILVDIITPKSFKSEEDVLNFYNKSKIEGLADYMLKYTTVKSDDGKIRLRFDKKNIAPKTMMENGRRSKILWRSARRLKMPVMLMRAEKSKIVNNRMVRLLKKVIPGLEVDEIPETTHELVFTHPKEVAASLDNYFNK